MKLLTTILAFGLLIVQPSCLAQELAGIPPKTVDSLDLAAYQGRWFIMYSSLIPTSTFLQGGLCAISDYGNCSTVDGKTSFTFVSSFRYNTPDGELKQASGTAINNCPDSAPGKFILDMESTSSPIDGMYWIVEVGEMGADGKYPWAIVSAPFNTVLFILARDVDRFRAELEPTALQKADAYGFKLFFNKPVSIYQSTSNCAYSPPPPY